MNAVVDRVVQYPHRYQLKNVNTGEVLGTFDLEPITGTISVVGTKIDKELFDSIADDISARLVSNGGDAKDNVITFNMASARSNVASGEKLSVSFGKIAKYFNDLKAVAFSGSKADVGLGNVDNTADANKPVSNATKQALDLKANASDVYSKTETDELLNDKANANDVYSKTETDGLLNDKANVIDVYSKTETDGLLNNKANKSDVYTKAEADTGLNKSLYNLGYYDTITANSDGTYTITRQTGYVTINVEDITSGSTTSVNSENAYTYVINKDTNAITNNEYSGEIIGISSNGYQVRYLYQEFTGPERIGIAGNRKTITLGFSSVKTQAEIQAMCPIFIQYKLATSYTEKVEANHYARYNQRFILEHNKSEAERSANLTYAISIKSTSVRFESCIILAPFDYKKGVTYSLSFDTENTGCVLYLAAQDDLGLAYMSIITDGTRKSFTFTSPKDVSNYIFYVRNNSTDGLSTGTCSNVMLNVGSTPLPYQPYNQNKHITNNEADFLKTEHDRSANLYSGVQTCSGSDTKTYFQPKLLGYKNDTLVWAKASDDITSVNKLVSFTFNKTSDINQIRFGHNGETHDILITYDISNLPNGTYTLSFLVTGYTGTQSFTNIMLNEGTEPLPYQPYEGKVVHEKELESITPGIFSLVGNNVDTLTISKNETYFITSVAVNPIYVEGNTGISFIGSSLVTTVGMLSGEPKICLNGSAYTLDNNSVTLKTSGLMKVYKLN